MRIGRPGTVRNSVFIPLLLAVGLAFQPFHAVAAQSVYRCWNFNAGGQAGYCRTSSPLVFNTDGTYQESSTRGRYTVSGNTLTMSRSTVRGPGRLSGNTLTFHYTYQNLPYTVTYLLQSGSPLSAGVRGGGDKSQLRTDPELASEGKVAVNLTIHFPRSDGSLGWMSLVILTPEGQPPARPAKIITTEAIIDRPTWSVRAQFDPPRTAVPVGAVYDVWVDTSMEKRRIGKLDLRGVRGDTDVSIDAHTIERR